MKRVLLALLLPLLLAACGKSVWAPDEAVARARYVSNEPPSISLFTVIRTPGVEGAHSGILINGSQRVLFDPAGNFSNPAVPERNDVLFGITPTMLNYYVDFHAREHFDVIEQKVPVSAAVAEMVMQRAMDNGPASSALCSRNVSNVLAGVPGFESVKSTFFPRTILREFGRMPGVVSTRYIQTPTGIQATVLTPEEAQYYQ